MFRESSERANAALRDAVDALDARNPMTATLLLAAERLAHPADRAGALDVWRARAPGNRLSDARYRWELRHDRAPGPWCDEPDTWVPWRPRDAEVMARKRDAFEQRLVLPIALADGLSLLSSESDAADLRAEAEPVMRTDLASYARGAHAWTDCFALYTITRRPAALERMRPFLYAIAAGYSPIVDAGRVLGSRFPFHGKPLVSASAMLASGLLRLGADIPIAADLLEYVASAVGPHGAFADADEPPDLFTTALAAELLGRVAPAFDPAPSARFVAERQGADGFFRALGPEAPWLTDFVSAWLASCERPFAERFEWPRVAEAERDSKTRLAPFAYFVDLAELFAQVPGLAGAELDVVFTDLIGFRTFNNTYGQEMGDEVLAEFAAAADALGASVAVRDGGDEVLLVGAPTATSLPDAIEQLRDAWPVRFRARFGDDAPPVAARYVVGRVRADRLRHAREVLGREVGALKHVDEVDPRGVRRDLGSI